MTKFLILALALLSTAAFAADKNYGRKLGIISDRDPEVFQFGVQYSPGRDASVYMSFEVRGSTLVGNAPGNVKPIYRSVINRANDRLLSAWENLSFDDSIIEPGSRQAITFQSKGTAEASAILRHIRTSIVAVALSADPRSPVSNVYFDLGELCEKYPDHFLNVDTGEQGCPAN